MAQKRLRGEFLLSGEWQWVALWGPEGAARSSAPLKFCLSILSTAQLLLNAPTGWSVIQLNTSPPLSTCGTPRPVGYRWWLYSWAALKGGTPHCTVCRGGQLAASLTTVLTGESAPIEMHSRACAQILPFLAQAPQVGLWWPLFGWSSADHYWYFSHWCLRASVDPWIKLKGPSSVCKVPVFTW